MQFVIMLKPIITWSKRYYEDLGTQDEEGFYDYAYRYFTYEFKLATGSRILVRRYTDEPERGSLFIYAAGMAYPTEEAVTTEKQFVSAVVGFLQEKEKITQFYYLANGYKPLATEPLGYEQGSFAFRLTGQE